MVEWVEALTEDLCLNPKQTPEAFPAASLAKTAGFRFSQRTTLKKRAELSEFKRLGGSNEFQASQYYIRKTCLNR